MSGPCDELRVFVTDTRRRWTVEEKLAIVAETRTRPVVQVARKHGVASGLLFRWRKMFADQAATPRRPRSANFIPVALPAPACSAQEAISLASAGRIEIVLCGGRRLIVDADIDVRALKRMAEALEQR